MSARQAGTAGPATVESGVQFHMGEVLLRLAAQYRGLGPTLLEAVQNGMDAGGTRILVGVNLQARVAMVLDNGDGTDMVSFGKALRSIGKSIKARDKFGKFGLGLISPVDECDQCLFTSWATSDGVIRQWTFSQTQIAPQDTSLTIPCKENLARFPRLPQWLAPHATDEFKLEWRTQVHLKGIKKDRASSTINLDEFEQEVRARFSIAMRERGILVRVVHIDTNGELDVRDINPAQYTGEPLDVVQYHEEETGTVTFTLYRAPERGRGRRAGEVVVMQTGDNTAVPIANFIRQARGRQWGDGLKAAFTVLSSGYFEGVIECDKIELDVSRKKFDFSDALQMLYLLIDAWYTEHGNRYFEAEREQSRETRWQQLGQQSRDWLKAELQQPGLRMLWERARDALPFIGAAGGSGDIDIRPDPPERSGESKEPRAQKRASSSGSPDADQEEASGAAGAEPEGEAKRTARRGGGGIVFEYRPLPGSSRLWEFDFETGVLAFNVRHPVWEMLDETNGRHTARNSRWIMELQEWVTIQVLYLLANNPGLDLFEQNRSYVDGLVRIHAEAFIMRRHQRRTTDQQEAETDTED